MNKEQLLQYLNQPEVKEKVMNLKSWKEVYEFTKIYGEEPVWFDYLTGKYTSYNQFHKDVDDKVKQLKDVGFGRGKMMTYLPEVKPITDFGPMHRLKGINYQEITWFMACYVCGGAWQTGSKPNIEGIPWVDFYVEKDRLLQNKNVAKTAIDKNFIALGTFTSGTTTGNPKIAFKSQIMSEWFLQNPLYEFWFAKRIKSLEYNYQQVTSEAYCLLHIAIEKIYLLDFWVLNLIRFGNCINWYAFDVLEGKLQEFNPDVVFTFQSENFLKCIKFNLCPKASYVATVLKDCCNNPDTLKLLANVCKIKTVCFTYGVEDLHSMIAQGSIVDGQLQYAFGIPKETEIRGGVLWARNTFQTTVIDLDKGEIVLDGTKGIQWYNTKDMWNQNPDGTWYCIGRQLDKQ